MLTVCRIDSKNNTKQKSQNKCCRMLHPKRKLCFKINKLSMLQILRFLINILKTPSPGKCRDLLGHSGDCREQRRNALKHILRFTFHSIPFHTHPKNFNNVVTRTNWKVITRQTAYISRVEAIAHHRTRLHRE